MQRTTEASTQGASDPHGDAHQLVRSSVGGPLVAIIDDNADIVEALSEALRERGYRVSGHRDGETALRALAGAEAPSLIVLDLMMPDMDGWTFRVRQREVPSLRDVPVIVMTASHSPQAEAIQADAYLRKPLGIERFCATVDQTLLASERKRLLARSVEVERLRALGLLVTSVAHEINNPLGYVGGNIELALRDCDRAQSVAEPAQLLARVRKSLHDARHGTTHIAEIVQSLLIFGRAEHDRSQVADLTRSLRAAARLSAAYAKRRATLRFVWPELPRVVGQEARLGQVFLNLLMNAVQALGPGGPDDNEIAVIARRDDPYVTVEITDTGCGIPPEQLPRIFDAFYTTKPAGEGTGIGLSFCKDIVERVGGSISVHSTVGRGSTFTVRLPIASDSRQLDA